MRSKKLNSPKNFSRKLAKVVLATVSASAVLCIPWILSASNSTRSSDPKVGQPGVFGIRGAMVGGALLGQSVGPLRAGGGTFDPTKDTDGDLLPDVLEWSLLSDPLKRDTDGDGTSDFVEALQFTSPIEKNKPQRIVDSYRLLFATTREGKSQSRYLWIHILLRMASGSLSDLKGITLFYDKSGSKVDLSSLIYTHTRDYKTRSSASQGVLARISLRIQMPQGFEKLAPGSFASHALINSTVHTASAQMFYLGGAFHTFSLVNSTSMILQTSGSGEAQTTFWTSGQACVLTLEVIGSSPGWRICEVKKAECKVVYRGACSASCLKSTGAAVLIADGTPLVEGG